MTIEEFEQSVHTLAQSLLNRAKLRYATRNHDREFIIYPNSIENPVPISVKLDQDGQVSYGRINCEVFQCDNCL